MNLILHKIIGTPESQVRIRTSSANNANSFVGLPVKNPHQKL